MRPTSFSRVTPGFRSGVFLALAAVALVSALRLASPVTSAGEDEVIAYDDFESNDLSGGTGWLGPWEATGAVDVQSSQNPQSGSKHLRLRGAANVYRTVDLSQWAEVELSFWAKAVDFEPGDTARLEVSSDGASWQTLETWQSDDDGEDHRSYEFYDFDFASLATTSAFYVRFVADTNDSDDFFFVDDVLFEGEAAAVPSPSPTPTPGPGPTPSPTPPPSTGVAIDGEFGDWGGYPHLTDPAGDASKARGDLSALYWANNGGSEQNFWMVERYPGEGGGQTKRVVYTIYIDTDDDGIFDETEDRRVVVSYKPKNEGSLVKVRVKRGDHSATIYSDTGDWGESKGEGGRRVELAVPWSALGIGFGSTVRMYVESDRDDRLPDSGDIQWSPASVLGYWVLGSLLLGGALIFWHIRRRKEKPCPSGEA